MPDTVLTMTNTPSEPDAARVALDGVASMGRAPSYGPARDWAHRVGMMEPPEILHRTASAPEGTSIADRRDALLGQVDGARAEYQADQRASASFAKEFPADGARQATGSRVGRPAGGTLKRD